MAKLDDAADAVIGLADKFRGILDLADELKKLGSVEQAIAERNAALTAASAQHDDIKSQIADSVSSLNEVRASGARDVAQASATATSVMADAKAGAERVLQEAHAGAAAMVTAARAEIDNLRSEHNRFMIGATQERDALNSQIAEGNTALNAQNAALAALQTQIAALKQTAQQIAG